MPIVTEAQLRNQIRQPQKGMSVHLPANARLSPSAQDFLKEWNMEAIFTDAASAPASESAAKAGWDKPGEFPVVLTGDLPRCATCGMPVKPKPEHLTQLDSQHFAPKTHPRIRFRGKMDTLHAHFLLASAQAAKEERRRLAQLLGSLASYCREISSAEYNQRKVAPLELDGKSDDELRQATHAPEKSVGIPHLVPGPQDSELLLVLNLLRCQVREVEITGLDAFSCCGMAEPHEPELARAVNRLSNAVYYLELLFAAGKLDTQGL